jgi:hypothetical protein
MRLDFSEQCLLNPSYAYCATQALLFSLSVREVVEPPPPTLHVAGMRRTL